MIDDSDLLRMANEAGLTDPDLDDWMIDYGYAKGSIKKFAAMVADRTRQAAANTAAKAIASEPTA